jgi:hypothetical protein
VDTYYAIERMLKMQKMRELLKDKKLIKKTDKYELYLNEETGKIMMYSIMYDDIWEISVDDLGDMGFSHYMN